MNIVRKSIFLGLLTIAASGCADSSYQPVREYPVQLCDKAKHGQLEVENTPFADPHINAYLLDCAVSVVISQVSLQNGSYKANNLIKRKKEMVGEHFLSQELDLTYRNEDGDNVLMSVITSFLSEHWKEKAVAILLTRGIDLKEKNHNADTALDIAKYKGNERIIKLVSFEYEI